MPEMKAPEIKFPGTRNYIRTVHCCCIIRVILNIAEICVSNINEIGLILAAQNCMGAFFFLQENENGEKLHNNCWGCSQFRHEMGEHKIQ